MSADDDGTRTLDDRVTVGHGASTALRGETTVIRSSRPVDLRRRVTGGERRDRVRWGPVWAGLVTALAVYLVLELALLATGLMQAGFGATEEPEGLIWSGVAALVAFFVGGLVAGASALWRAASDGAFHGILVWCLGVVAFLLLTLLSTGLALGTLSDLSARLGVTADDAEGFDTDQANDDAKEAAAKTLLFLGLTAGAAAAGGAVGSKLWPGRRDEASDALDRGDEDGR